MKLKKKKQPYEFDESRLFVASELLWEGTDLLPIGKDVCLECTECGAILSTVALIAQCACKNVILDFDSARLTAKNLGNVRFYRIECEAGE